MMADTSCGPYIQVLFETIPHIAEAIRRSVSDMQAFVCMESRRIDSYGVKACVLAGR